MTQKVITKWNNIEEGYHRLAILFCHIQIPNRLKFFFTTTVSEFPHIGQIFSHQTDLKQNNWGWLKNGQILNASRQYKYKSQRLLSLTNSKGKGKYKQGDVETNLLVFCDKWSYPQILFPSLMFCLLHFVNITALLVTSFKCENQTRDHNSAVQLL